MCNKAQINCFTKDGGYVEYVILRQEAVVRVLKDLAPAEATPLLIAALGTAAPTSILQIEP